MNLFLQIWGGCFYLLNKVFFAIFEGKTDRISNKIRIAGWIVYILGVPPWVIILIENQDWIAASIEAGGVPAMLLGLYVAWHGNRKPRKFIYHVVTILTYTSLTIGVNSFTQLLEIGVMFGFLLSGYYLAKNNPIGWLFFMLGNVSMAALMYMQNAPILMVQQLVSLFFVIYGFVISIKYKLTNRSTGRA